MAKQEREEKIPALHLVLLLSPHTHLLGPPRLQGEGRVGFPGSRLRGGGLLGGALGIDT